MPDTAGVDSDRLTARLTDLVARAPGRLSLAVRSSSGFRFDHDATRVVPSASTIKVAILLAYLESGMPWDLPVGLPPGDRRVGGCGPLSLLPSVTSLPAGELLTLMIALSDNDATNAILDVLGVGAVSRLLARAGARHTVLRRRMMDPAAVAAGRENETTAAEQAELLAQLRSGALLPQRETAARGLPTCARPHGEQDRQPHGPAPRRGSARRRPAVGRRRGPVHRPARRRGRERPRPGDDGIPGIRSDR